MTLAGILIAMMLAIAAGKKPGRGRRWTLLLPIGLAVAVTALALYQIYTMKRPPAF